MHLMRMCLFKIFIKTYDSWASDCVWTYTQQNNKRSAEFAASFKLFLLPIGFLKSFYTCIQIQIDSHGRTIVYKL